MRRQIEGKCVCGHTRGWHGKKLTCFANNGRCKCKGFVKTCSKPINNDVFVCAKCGKTEYLRLSRGYSFCLLCQPCYNKENYYDFINKLSKKRPEIKKKLNSIFTI